MHDIDDPDSPHQADPVWAAYCIGWAVGMLCGLGLAFLAVPHLAVPL